MDTIKTLADWQQYMAKTGDEILSHYLFRGDLISEDFLEYLKDTMPVQSRMEHYYVQLGEPQGFAYNAIRAWKPLYFTFGEHQEKVWLYYGCCFLHSNLDQSW